MTHYLLLASWVTLGKPFDLLNFLIYEIKGFDLISEPDNYFVTILT